MAIELDWAPYLPIPFFLLLQCYAIIDHRRTEP